MNGWEDVSDTPSSEILLRVIRGSDYELTVILNSIAGLLAILSFTLLLWQWLAARRFPLHRRTVDHSFPPAVTLLKPLKGCEPTTELCLRSWLTQDYTGRVQVLFGVSSSDDPVCQLIQNLKQEFHQTEIDLIVCGPLLGANAKVSKLVQLEPKAKYEVLVISDADVRVPPDFLANLVEPLRKTDCGLVNCFYQLAQPATLAMQWEAIAINADFWSQVLQSKSLKPLDFALGAVMATGRKQLAQIGGFSAFVDYLADDYELGHRIARSGWRIELATVVVECLSSPMGWKAVWKHQLRWARTIRVCQPLPYFFSIVSNPTIWPLAWLLINPGTKVLGVCIIFWGIRMLAALDLQKRLTRDRRHFPYVWLTPVKDLLQAVIWLLSFAGNRIEWRGEQMLLRRNGVLERLNKKA